MVLVEPTAQLDVRSALIHIEATVSCVFDRIVKGLGSEWEQSVSLVACCTSLSTI
jgi:hypothetical protein